MPNNTNKKKMNLERQVSAAGVSGYHQGSGASGGHHQGSGASGGHRHQSGAAGGGASKEPLLPIMTPVSYVTEATDEELLHFLGYVHHLFGIIHDKKNEQRNQGAWACAVNVTNRIIEDTIDEPTMDRLIKNFPYINDFSRVNDYKLGSYDKEASQAAGKRLFLLYGMLWQCTLSEDKTRVVREFYNPDAALPILKEILRLRWKNEPMRQEGIQRIFREFQIARLVGRGLPNHPISYINALKELEQNANTQRKPENHVHLTVEYPNFYINSYYGSQSHLTGAHLYVKGTIRKNKEGRIVGGELRYDAALFDAIASEVYTLQRVGSQVISAANEGYTRGLFNLDQSQHPTREKYQYGSNGTAYDPLVTTMMAAFIFRDRAWRVKRYEQYIKDRLDDDQFAQLNELCAMLPQQDPVFYEHEAHPNPSINVMQHYFSREEEHMMKLVLYGTLKKQGFDAMKGKIPAFKGYFETPGRSLSELKRQQVTLPPKKVESAVSRQEWEQQERLQQQGKLKQEQKQKEIDDLKEQLNQEKKEREKQEKLQQGELRKEILRQRKVTQRHTPSVNRENQPVSSVTMSNPVSRANSKTEHVREDSGYVSHQESPSKDDNRKLQQQQSSPSSKNDLKSNDKKSSVATNGALVGEGARPKTIQNHVKHRQQGKSSAAQPGNLQVSGSRFFSTPDIAMGQQNQHGFSVLTTPRSTLSHAQSYNNLSEEKKEESKAKKKPGGFLKLFKKKGKDRQMGKENSAFVQSF